MSLTAGVVTLVYVDSSNAYLSSTPATGGVGPYTYQWYRSTVSGFTPGPSNLVTAATALSLVDRDLVPATPYFYVLVSTDTGASNVTVLSAQQTVTTLTTIRIGYMGALGAQLTLARQAGYDLIAVTNITDLMTQMATAASHGQRKFTITYPVVFQPADLRGNTSCSTIQRRGNGCGCGQGGYNNCNCNNGNYNSGNYNSNSGVYVTPPGGSLNANGYIGNGCGSGYGPLWPAFQSGIYAALFMQNIMENEVTATLNLSDNVTTSVDLNFTF